MSPQFRPPVLVWLILALSTLVSIWVAADRHRGESSNRAVHFLVDWPDVRAVAAASGSSVRETLDDLRTAGVTGVAVAEDSWSDLLESGRIGPAGEDKYSISDRALAQRVSRVLAERSPVGDISTSIATPTGIVTTAVPGSALRALGMGFDADVVKQVRDSGLAIVARLSNPPSANERSISNIVAEAKSIGAVGVLLSGDQVLGRRDLVPFAAEQIKQSGMWFGAVEFAAQGGLPRMMHELMDETVRVHSMVAAEIDKNELPDIIDRYVRAVVERNIRAVFLRPISNASSNPLSAFTEFVAKVRAGVEREGFEAKPAHTDYPQSRPAWAAAAIAFGIAVCTIWLLSTWLNGICLVAIGALLLALVGGVYVGFGAKYMGLVAALVFPTWGVLAAFSSDNSGGGFGKWFIAYFWITAISVIGGLHVAGLLTELPFMLRLDQFMGVKAAHFVPPLIVAVVLLLQQVKWGDLLDGKVRWFDIAMLSIVGVAMLLMLARTGNDAPGDVSSLELKMRNVLDAVLPERPRTKEFLIGYPALVIALWLAYTNRRRFLPLLALLICIGQASVLNTFCHLHTPLTVSLWRVVTGLVVGGVIGLFVLPFVRMFSGRERSSAS